jgi:triacylglycerol lipase
VSDFEFNLTQCDFNLVNALGCARASSLAYEDSATVKQTIAKWGFDRLEVFIRKQHFGIVFGNDKMVLIAFRGTNERADWRTNLNILFKRSPLGMVHRGFMKATELFWPDLPKMLSVFCNKNQGIWLSGHSLGGALAMLTATKLCVEQKHEIAGIYTFGQPPVGVIPFCIRFEEKFSNRYFRFVNSIDFVSDAPILFRTHVDEGVRYFDTSGKLFSGNPPWKEKHIP